MIAERSVVEACDSPTVSVPPLVRATARSVPHDGKIGELLEEVVVHGAKAHSTKKPAHRVREDGRLYFNARNHRGTGPARVHAYSSDGGETLDAPYAGIDEITAPGRRIGELPRLLEAVSRDRKNLSS